MRKTIRSLFKELFIEIFKIAFLNSFIDAAIVFFALMILFIFFRVSYLFAVMGTVLFLIINIAVRMKRIRLSEVEKRNPEVRDILSTAKDHINKDNPLVSEMFEDLVRRMKSVSIGTMLDNKAFTVKITVTVVLCIAAIFMSAQNLNYDRLGLGLDDIPFFSAKKPAAQIYEFELNESEDIYGDAKQISFGDREVSLQINPAFNELNLDDVREEEEKEFIEGSYPSDIGAVSDMPSEERLPKEADIAIAYNLKLQE